MKTGCVILAGGKSSRMGTDKALLEMNGEKFIEHLMHELKDFDEKLIARGGNSLLPIEADWKVIPDKYQDRGPLGGLHSALEECSSDALFCVTCDMPLFKNVLAARVCAELDDTCDAVIVETPDGRVHPLCGVYRKNLAHIFEEQLLSGNNRVMRALDKVRLKIMKISAADFAHQLTNVNTPEEYLELKK